MAFTLERFGKTSVTAAKAPLIWTYDPGEDNEASYLQAGYFDKAYPSLGKGHLIYVSGNDNFSMLRVTDVSPSQTNKITVTSVLKNLVTLGHVVVQASGQSTFTIPAPGSQLGDIGFVQVFSGTDSPVVRVQAINGQVFFAFSSAQNSNFEVNYAVFR